MFDARVQMFNTQHSAYQLFMEVKKLSRIVKISDLQSKKHIAKPKVNIKYSHCSESDIVEHITSNCMLSVV